VASATPRLAVSMEEIEFLNGKSRSATVRRGDFVKVVQGATDGSVSSR
jgi:hypothetical protein